MKAQERLYLTADSKVLVRDGDNRAATLYCSPGDIIPDGAAARFGLVDGLLGEEAVIALVEPDAEARMIVGEQGPSIDVPEAPPIAPDPALAETPAPAPAATPAAPAAPTPAPTPSKPAPAKPATAKAKAAPKKAGAKEKAPAQDKEDKGGSNKEQAPGGDKGAPAPASSLAGRGAAQA